MEEKDKTIVHSMRVSQDIGTYDPMHMCMKLYFHKDGSVSWAPIPLDELSFHLWTYDPEKDTVVRGERRSW